MTTPSGGRVHQEPHKSAGGLAARIAVTYAVVSAVWIVGSDTVVLRFGLLDLPHVQTYKGLVFVAVTAMALFLIVRVQALAALQAGNEAAASIQASERRYRELFESNPLPMFVYDLETLVFLDVNSAAVEHYGYSREEFLGMTIADIRPVEDVPRLLDNVAQVIDGIDRAGIWRHLTKDGRTLLVEITSHVFEYEGRRAELVLADDVTAMLEATSALRRTAARLSALFQTAPVAVILVNSESVVTEWNPGAERMFGWTAGEVVGKALPILPPDSVELFAATLEESLLDEEPRRYEGRRLTKSGSLVDVVAHTAPLKTGEGDVDEVMAIILDVSEEKRAELELRLYRERLEELVEARTRELATVNEQLQLATRVKSEFLANMSHELRTPLNSIIGFSGILMQGLTGELTEEQAKQVGMVHRSGKHLLELINDILDISRIEAGRVSVDPVGMEICALVGSLVDDLQSLAELKGIELRSDVCEELKIRSDRTKIRQILYNLVGNAIKFTAEGQIVVSVESSDSSVIITVEDTGSGIAPDEIDSIFDEFHQARRRADEKPPGTGLGLAISRKLARMLGGDISVLSEVGKGSTFRLEVLREAPVVVSETAGRSSDEVAG